MGVGSLLGNFESWPNLFQRSSLWFVQSGKSFLLLTKSSFTADWFLSTISVRNFNSYAAEEYGRIRPDLERKGTTIGPMGMLIEAHIKAEDYKQYPWSWTSLSCGSRRLDKGRTAELDFGKDCEVILAKAWHMCYNGLIKHIRVKAKKWFHPQNVRTCEWNSIE